MQEIGDRLVSLSRKRSLFPWENDDSTRARDRGAAIADGLEAAKEWARQRDVQRQVEEEAFKQQRAAHEAELARLQQLLADAQQRMAQQVCDG